MVYLKDIIHSLFMNDSLVKNYVQRLFWSQTEKSNLFFLIQLIIFWIILLLIP